jgi:hypothetical protein
MMTSCLNWDFPFQLAMGPPDPHRSFHQQYFNVTWVSIYISEPYGSPRHANRVPQLPESSAISAGEALQLEKGDTSPISFT